MPNKSSLLRNLIETASKREPDTLLLDRGRIMPAALKYAARAVATAGKIGGNLAYYYALTQRVHALAQLGCEREARLDFQLAFTAQFPVIQSALKVLAEQFPEIALLPEKDQKCSNAASRSAIIPFWQDRREKKTTVHLSKLGSGNVPAQRKYLNLAIDCQD